MRTIYTCVFVFCCTLLGLSEPIVDEGSEVKKIKGGFQFTEGPAWNGVDQFVFSDIPPDRIYQYDRATDRISVFRENTGGANGLMYDADGRLVMCEGDNRRVTRLEPNGSITVLADRWDGNKLNSPNDLVIRDNGGIYFTDPRYGDRSSMEMDVEGVYYISPDGELRRVIDHLTRPNGIMLSRDGETLYVADPGEGRTWAYDVDAGGAPTNRRLFAESGSDGMTIDSEGNLYLTSGAVLVFSPDGKRIDTIDVPEKPTNVTFGPPDGSTLYITARTGFYRVKTTVQRGR